MREAESVVQIEGALASPEQRRRNGIAHLRVETCAPLVGLQTTYGHGGKLTTQNQDV